MRSLYIKILFLTTFLSVLLAGCGEDRTYEYNALTEHNRWVQSVMEEQYLWGDSIKSQEWKDYFNSPADFFEKLKKLAPVTDNWSYVELDTVAEDKFERGFYNHLKSYGLDFVLMNDPTGGTTRSYARVTTVMAGSPAERAGLTRGMFIGAVGGEKITTSNTSMLTSGLARTLSVSILDVDADEGVYFWKREMTIEMEAAEYVEDHAFPLSTTFTASGIKFGYLMCNRLCAQPLIGEPSNTDYLAVLKSQLATIRRSGAEQLILDLRLCNSGTMEMAQALASSITPSAMGNEVFAQTMWRESLSEKNCALRFDQPIGGERMQFNRIYVITSKYTKGAAEWLVRSLQSAMKDDVWVFGEKTAGQNVMLADVHSETFRMTVHPAVAYVANAEGNYEYGSGIFPDVSVEETNYLYLYPYGSKQEAVIAEILESL